MPRLQILELPTEHHGDNMTTPFVIVLDEMAGAPLTEEQRHTWGTKEMADRLARLTGARCAVAFPFRVDLPANDPQTDPR